MGYLSSDWYCLLRARNYWLLGSYLLEFETISFIHE